MGVVQREHTPAVDEQAADDGGNTPLKALTAWLEQAPLAAAGSVFVCDNRPT